MWRHRETGTFWLYDIQGLEVGPELLGFRVVFIRGDGLVRLCGLDGVILASWEVVDPDDLEGLGADDGRDGKRVSVVVRVGFGWVGRVTHVQEALVHAVIVANTIRTCGLVVSTDGLEMSALQRYSP